jgi:glycosyltransferase involved in cell wall biosynthesis
METTGMRIGFDAKRAFFNQRGLGNYSRNTLLGLSTFFPENKYLLFSPKPCRPSLLFQPPANCAMTGPSAMLCRKFPSLWRSLGMGTSIRKYHLDLFHGLSNELPLNIRAAKTPVVVTIHDLIQCRYPQMYHWDERLTYNFKYRRSAENADLVIATSQQTKEDLIRFWKIPENKIRVVYQGCSPDYEISPPESLKQEIITKYGLPEHFLLSVGAIETRKNLLLVLQALAFGKIDIPLVICGVKTDYYHEVIHFATRHKISHQLIYLHSLPNQDLTVIYHLAEALVYPSRFEGFGIPVLEGMTSGIPVITSTQSCLPEIGGDACIYVDPDDTEAMIQAIHTVLNNQPERKRMITAGKIRSENFKPEVTTKALMNVYQEILNL